MKDSVFIILFNMMRKLGEQQFYDFRFIMKGILGILKKAPMDGKSQYCCIAETVLIRCRYSGGNVKIRIAYQHPHSGSLR